MSQFGTKRCGECAGNALLGLGDGILLLTLSHPACWLVSLETPVWCPLDHLNRHSGTDVGGGSQLPSCLLISIPAVGSL